MRRKRTSAECPDCGRRIQQRLDGTICAHTVTRNQSSGRCSGDGKLPAPPADRFFIQPVAGFISPMANGRNRHNPGASFVVLDRAFNYKLLAEFRSEEHSRNGKIPGTEKALDMAVAYLLEVAFRH